MTPTPSPVVSGCSIYNLQVNSGIGGIFEYYYEPCFVNDCGYQPMAHGVVDDFPFTVEFCARFNSVVFPPQYTDYQLTLVCHDCCDGPVIDGETEINIFIDDSGSMSSTEASLENMATRILKPCLLSFYDNDSDLYDQRVRVRKFSDMPSSYERGYKLLATSGSTSNITKVINLVFQDEAHNVYTGNDSTWTNTTPRTADYDTDIASLRSIIDNNSSDYIRGEYFQVRGTGQSRTNFKILLESVMNGSGVYFGVNGLSDKSQIDVTYDVENGGYPIYYANLIISAINGLGYNIPICDEPDVFTDFIYFPNL